MWIEKKAKKIQKEREKNKNTHTQKKMRRSLDSQQTELLRITSKLGNFENKFKKDNVRGVSRNIFFF